MDTNVIMNQLTAVVNALNAVEVKGQSNLINLSASISILNDLRGALANDQQGKDNTKEN